MHAQVGLVGLFGERPAMNVNVCVTKELRLIASRVHRLADVDRAGTLLASGVFPVLEAGES